MTWKEAERYIARRFGGRRMGATGVGDADVITPDFCIQVKYRKVLPKWVNNCVVHVGAARKRGLIGICVFSTRTPPKVDAVITSLLEFERIHKSDFPDPNHSIIPDTYFEAPGVWVIRDNRRTFPYWLAHAIDNAGRNAEKSGLTPVTILKERNVRWDNAVVIIPSGEFAKLVLNRA